jgi:hypothetical protein
MQNMGYEENKNYMKELNKLQKQKSGSKKSWPP